MWYSSSNESLNIEFKELSIKDYSDFHSNIEDIMFNGRYLIISLSRLLPELYDENKIKNEYITMFDNIKLEIKNIISKCIITGNDTSISTKNKIEMENKILKLIKSNLKEW